MELISDAPPRDEGSHLIRVGFRWWPRSEILSSVERFYPGRLPALLDAFLDGEQINEPFELWS